MRRRSLLAVVLLVAATVPGASAATVGSSLPAETTGSPAGCPVFPSDNYWHADVSALPEHPLSDDWLARMSPGRDLHPDFGGPYGIPVTRVGAGHPRVHVRFDYAAESDRVRYPLGRSTRVEGGRGSDGDRHAVVVDRSRCRLYETWATRKRDGRWHAGSGATWSLLSNALRPDGWTSADAAGLPILPGLLRWREVKERRVDHAIRFTTDVTSTWHLWPARHDAGSRESHAFPPMGARFRLDPAFDTTGLGSATREVVRAMQVYGLVLADNGSPWFFQGEKHRRWPDRLVQELKTIPASAFVAVDAESLRVSWDSAEVRGPDAVSARELR